MRSAVSALTPRGRTLLCAGVALLVGALVVGERDLFRAGVLVSLLPLLGAVTIVRLPHQIQHARALEPWRIPLGQQVRVRLRVRNSSRRRPTAALLLTDTLPAALTGAPRFSLGRLGPDQTREMTYRVRPHARGRFPIGPLALGVVDPLGCVTLTRRVGSSMALLVTPATVALPPVILRGDSADRGESRTRTMASAGEDDTVPREYRHGDDLRRVHWRSTARQGQLMVRREEQQWLDHSTLLLDVRASAHTADTPDSSLETAVSVAASIAVRLLDDGHNLRFLTNGTEISTQNRAEVILDALAVIQASPSPDLHGGSGLLGHAGAGAQGLAVAVLGALRPEEVDGLTRAVQAHRRNCLAILLSHAPWAAPTALETAREALVRAKWRVLVIADTAELPGKWAGLARGTWGGQP